MMPTGHLLISGCNQDGVRVWALGWDVISNRGSSAWDSPIGGRVVSSELWPDFNLIRVVESANIFDRTSHHAIGIDQTKSQPSW